MILNFKVIIILTKLEVKIDPYKNNQIKSIK